jgi:hypothetical protein
MIAPHRTATIPTSGIGQPLLAARPAKTLQRANCEPMEMSICRQIITRVMPQAAIKTGTASQSIERSCAGLKKSGARKASKSRMARNATKTDHSRK